MFNNLHNEGKFLKIAHRGYSQYYGDNNMLSFEKAVENNFDMLEIDIQLSKDNDIVLFHDNMIQEYYVNELKTEYLYVRFNIITLEHFFKNFKYKDIKINFDLKGDNIILVEKLINLLYKYRIDDSLIYISSFNRNYLKQLIPCREKYKMMFKIGFITCNIFNEDELLSLLKNMDFFVVDYSILTQKTIDLCHQYKKKVFTFTNKDIYTFSLINKYNVDGIFSDCKFPDINQI